MIEVMIIIVYLWKKKLYTMFLADKERIFRERTLEARQQKTGVKRKMIRRDKYKTQTCSELCASKNIHYTQILLSNDASWFVFLSQRAGRRKIAGSLLLVAGSRIR